MKKVLITGGAGFIGLHLARRLAGRYEVDLLDDFSRGKEDQDLKDVLSAGKVRLFKKDLLSPDALSGLGNDYSLIYHLAAIVVVSNVVEAPYRVLYENTVLLARVIELAKRQAALERFLFASTSEVYAGTLETFGIAFPTPETTPLAIADVSRPRTSYLLSKITGEALCHYSGLHFTIVRPHNVYGPRMGTNHVIPELMQRISRASELKVYSPEHRRVFCYVDDAVELIERASGSPKATGRTLNIGNPGPEISMRDLAKLIAGVMGKKVNLADGEVTPGSPERRWPDMKKTMELTGYGSWVALEEGIRRTYEWYKKK
ncbi:MAG: NAD-dependent epimerase/dehydratase family protein [Candidatus Omnitrophica bacterium]|nr:NAD-dependent epimerase/dehydratase family protein [Candidatus Omnitrophota bacterium]